jgi:hypothetical protein
MATRPLIWGQTALPLLDSLHRSIPARGELVVLRGSLDQIRKTRVRAQKCDRHAPQDYA